MRGPATLLALTALLLAGCGGVNKRNHDVKGFVASGRTAPERAVLSSIATYRTTTDEARACSLVTQHFMDGRFEGKERNCEQVQRTADRFLPDSAKVESIAGDSARVLVDEPTATKSVYAMRREGGSWKVDDITEAR
ncbi:MAG: hypothetical protein QOG63_2535 [Thermoleophilaceae bacterium]|nr:hypothetical protein [Thermoleophilaceae bacterium]